MTSSIPAMRPPITSVEDIKALAHPEAWKFDEEFTDFLVDLCASRHSDASWA